MSNKEMSIKEKIKARRAAEVQHVEIAGLGEIGIRRIRTREMLELSQLPDGQSGVALVVLCAVDEEGGPLFASADEVNDLDWPLTQALMKACSEVNDLGSKVESAAKK